MKADLKPYSCMFKHKLIHRVTGENMFTRKTIMAENRVRATELAALDVETRRTEGGLIHTHKERGLPVLEIKCYD